MKGRPIKYSADELAWIKANCTMDRREAVSIFNERFGRDIALVNFNSLCKRKGWLTGRTGRYEKGNVPHPNARPKGPNSGSFKKGNRPHNAVEVGTKVKSTDGYWKVKVAEPDVWEWIHRRNWEQANGPLSEGDVVLFIDGDMDNYELDNLKLIDRATLARLNYQDFSSLPTEFRESAILIAQIETLIHKNSEAA